MHKYIYQVLFKALAPKSSQRWEQDLGEPLVMTTLPQTKEDTLEHFLDLAFLNFQRASPAELTHVTISTHNFLWLTISLKEAEACPAHLLEDKCPVSPSMPPESSSNTTGPLRSLGRNRRGWSICNVRIVICPTVQQRGILVLLPPPYHTHGDKFLTKKVFILHTNPSLPFLSPPPQSSEGIWPSLVSQRTLAYKIEAESSPSPRIKAKQGIQS